MTELFNDAKKFLERRSSLQALASEYQAGSSVAAGEGVHVAVPSVIAGLRDRADNSAGILGLLGTLRNFDVSELDSPAVFSVRSQRSAIGPDLARQIFGSNHASVVSAIADEARIQLTTADGIVGSAAWLVMAGLADGYGPSLDRQTLQSVLNAEQQQLESLGWRRWFSAIGLALNQVAAPAANATRSLAVSGDRPTTAEPTQIHQVVASGSGDDAGRYPPPVRSPQRPAPQPVRPGIGDGRPPTRPSSAPGVYPPPRRTGGPGGSDRAYSPPTRDPFAPSGPGTGPVPYRPEPNGRGRDTGPITQGPATGSLDGDRYGSSDYGMRREQAPVPPRRPRTGSSFDPAPEPRRRILPLLLAGMGVILLGLIGWLFMTDRLSFNSNPEVTDTEAADGDTGEAPVDDVGTTSTSISPADAVADDVADAAVLPELIELSVPMTDIFTSTEKSGLAELVLDTVNGEICYVVTTDGVGGPYDAHIHSGEIGVKGGIVIDFGDFQNPESGCLISRPVDVQAIARNLEKFYVEMHDVNDVEAIRGQLSAGLSAAQADAIDAAAGGGENADVLFDPNGGGASTVIESGRVVLSGAVADQATVDLLVGQFDDLAAAGTEIVNDLTIDPSAPLPTGTISIDDSVLFAIGSAELNDADSQVLADLAEVIKARPDWSVLIVGHTDDTGTQVLNLELSQQRANSVFDVMVDLGVPAEQMRTEGAGSTNPVADNGTEEGRAQNRRITFEVDQNR